MPDWPAAMRADRAAAYLDVSPTYFREHIAPAVPAIRPTPRVILYLRRDLDAWLDRHSPGSAASEEVNPWHPV
jgi:hypothetical protein